MEIFILMLVLQGDVQQVAATPTMKVCGILAEALNTHPNMGDGTFYCVKETRV